LKDYSDNKNELGDFMSWIPGWGSVAGAEWWSGFYFWLSISCLIGLGITEVASHRYGERKDELAAAEQAAKDKRHDEDVARLQHDTAQANERAAQLGREAAEATKTAALANERAAELKLALEREIAARQPRRITSAQQSQIVDTLRQAAKGPVSVTWKLFDEEATQYGKDVEAALKAAGYDVKEERGAFSFGIPGQWMMVPDRFWFERPTYAGEIQTALQKATGVLFDGQARPPDFKIEGDVVLVIGSKPP
jgi:hypothetical protein